MKSLVALVVALLAVIAFLLARPPSQIVVMAAPTPSPATPPPLDPAAEMAAIFKEMDRDQEKAAELLRDRQAMRDAELALELAKSREKELEDRAAAAREAVLGHP